MSGAEVLDALRIRFAELQSVPETTWARRQDDETDRRTRFIYECQSLERVYALARNTRLNDADTVYAAHRWKNFKRHDAWLELILESTPTLRRHPNPRERHIDFWWPLDGLDRAFDLKVTRWPRAVKASADASEVVRWLYQNQSREGRHDRGSRLFIVGHPESTLYDFDRALGAAQKFARDPQAHVMRPTDVNGAPAAIITMR